MQKEQRFQKNPLHDISSLEKAEELHSSHVAVRKGHVISKRIITQETC